jgi:hypothetical protein
MRKPTDATARIVTSIRARAEIILEPGIILRL